MDLLSLILFIVAATVFGIAAYLTKNLVALGLCILTIGFMAQFLIAPTIGAGH